MKTQAHEAATIGAADFIELARQSRERALAAREAAELTPEQAAEVGGGAYGLIAEPFPRGVLPWWKLSDMFKTPIDHTISTDIASGGMF